MKNKELYSYIGKFRTGPQVYNGPITSHHTYLRSVEGHNGS